MRIFDTSKREKVEFSPIKDGEVSIYLCGPTVYDDAHLGHAKSAVSFDLLRRVLKALGYKVKFARNYTDIDDKILNKMAQTGQSLEEITNKYIAHYESDMKALNVLDPDFKPKATQCLEAIISYIKVLMDRGVAYKTSDGIYFDTSKDSGYFSISGKDNNTDLIARVASFGEKRDEKDFVLWKFDEKWYESPFGKGRPGWHTECVAMIREFLSDKENDKFEIDIHAGGIDLLFPHHENEASQCRCAYHKNLSKYWMHNGFVNIDNVKMSKSLGNFITVHDALKNLDGQVLRFFFATQHYRKPINFTEKAVRDAETNLKYLKNTYEQPFTGKVDVKELQAFKDKFVAAMDEDFNAANGITVVFEMAKWINSGNYDESVKQALADMLEVFGIIFVEEVLDAEIESLIQKRQEARANRDFATADQIRDQLAAQGIKLLDTKDGVRWTRD